MAKRKIAMYQLLCFLSVGLTMGLLPSARPRTICFGPGAEEVKLCAAKLAAKSQCETKVVITKSDERELRRVRGLMYGREYAEKGIDGKGKAKPIVGVEAVGEALKSCEAAIVCADPSLGGPTDGALRAIFGNAPNLRHVALLSTLGGGKSSGFLTKSLAPAEDQLLALGQQYKKVATTIIRVGNLKGGGPGVIQRKGDKAGQAVTDFGLDRYYYDTIGDLSTASVCMAYDQFTLGATVTPGDPLSSPNPFKAAFSAQTFDPLPEDCSRVAAAGALVAAVRRRNGGEFTISSAEGTVPLSPEEWLRALDQAAASS